MQGVSPAHGQNAHLRHDEITGLHDAVSHMTKFQPQRPDGGHGEETFKLCWQHNMIKRNLDIP